MLKRVRQLFEDCLVTAAGDARVAGEGSEAAEHAYRLATATLLVEMMRADFEVRDSELEIVLETISKAFELPRSETSALVAEAESAADAATSLHEFTSLINAHLSPEQKYHVIELLWRVAFADGKIDKYEDHLVRKIADLIYVRHREFIRAKLTVQRELEQGPEASRAPR